MNNNPSIGRVVHYVLSPNDNVRPQAVGEHRPAFVVRVFENVFRDNPDCTSGLNLQVFLDGGNDVEGSGDVYRPTSPLWATSREYSTDGRPGTWHWPERV